MSINEKMKKYLNQQIQQEKKRTSELQELLVCKEQIETYQKQIQEYEQQTKEDKEKIRKLEYMIRFPLEKNTQESQELLDCKEQIETYQKQIQVLVCRIPELEYRLEEDEQQIKKDKEKIKNLEDRNSELVYKLEANIHARLLLEKELQELKKKKIHKKIITFSPLSDSEIQKISQE